MKTSSNASGTVLPTPSTTSRASSHNPHRRREYIRTLGGTISIVPTDLVGRSDGGAGGRRQGRGAPAARRDGRARAVRGALPPVLGARLRPRLAGDRPRPPRPGGRPRRLHGAVERARSLRPDARQLPFLLPLPG